MDIKKEIQRVLDIESGSIAKIKERISDDFVKAIELINKCGGKVVVTGIGKSGLIGQKISATFSSTGTRSTFLHPVEAAHGDMGIMEAEDVVIAISQSGETEEILEILPSITGLGVKVIAVTGKTGSTLAKKSGVVLDSSVKEEACPMNLAPTASTAVQLAIGDALAVALLKLKDFKEEDFAKLHPGGALGKKLVLKVKDIMHTGDDIPVVSPDTKLQQGLLVMTNKRFGCTAVTDKEGRIKGIFTDGDLRRLLEKTENPFSMKMEEIMTKAPKTIESDALVLKALNKMESSSITVLMAVNKEGRVEGVIHLHDIIKAGVV